ncbi:MAG: Glycosyltransferase [Candidatus Daviesbacteria bacterium GW2011_GWF2_38_7]|nr:MAG: Glycosyltransferase [Candidatus Daviesbacteria bacterium GW2011_GWF2_38_7]
MNNSGVSVFFPCINEEGNIENIVGRAEEVLRKLRVKYEIIIIDDGSSDQTGQIADKLSR